VESFDLSTSLGDNKILEFFFAFCAEDFHSNFLRIEKIILESDEN